MRKQQEVGADVAAVMAANPAFVWWGGLSFSISVLSFAFLGVVALDGALKGSAVAAGQVAACLVAYGVLWLSGAGYGSAEGLGNAEAEREAFKGAVVVRAGLLVLGVALLGWWMPGGPRFGEAALTAVFWLGAVGEGVCVGRIARDRRVSVWKALRVAGRLVAWGKGKERPAREEVVGDG